MRAYPIPIPITSVSTATAAAAAFAPFPNTRLFLPDNKTPSLLSLSTTCCTCSRVRVRSVRVRLITPLYSNSDDADAATSSSSDTTEPDDDDDDDVYFDDDDDDDGFVLSDEKKTQTLSEEGFFIEIKKLGANSRSIRSKIGIEANLDTVWNILTDYEKLSDIIPGLAVSKVVEKKDNFVRIYQIGQQNLAFGVKFNAKGVLDCYEKELEILPSGKRREIQFKMIEGDFTRFEGTWSVEQFNKGTCESKEAFHGQEFQTTLSYLVDVKPKMWLPVRLVEGRLTREIKTNLSCIRDEAKRVINALRSL